MVSVMKRIILLTIVGVFFGYIVYQSYLKQRPDTNTPEYLAAHGVFRGSINSVVVGDTVFTIPKDVDLNVYTSGKIKKGRADVLKFTMDFPELVDDEDSNFWGNYRVRVEISDRVSAEINPKEVLNDDKWVEVIERPEMGLYELHELLIGGTEIHPSFLAIEKVTFPETRQPYFHCWGSLSDFYMCSTSAQFPNGIHVKLYLTDELIPNWSSVYLRANKQVSNFMEYDK